MATLGKPKIQIKKSDLKQAVLKKNKSLEAKNKSLELSIKDKIARSNFNVEGKRKPSYILFDMDSQFLPWGRTSPATNREIDFVNSKSVSENTNLVNEENVTNTPSSVISNILRDGRPFHMVSTASDNIPMGHIISYMPINKEKLQKILQM